MTLIRVGQTLTKEGKLTKSDKVVKLTENTTKIKQEVIKQKPSTMTNAAGDGNPCACAAHAVTQKRILKPYM